ncbi:hypothetical protein N7474_006919 [Penicillium riverlandense]|uniref:uncharacterized protein n=1 Tax=Penicillium riverlandense TaxID=1903569 RepID=UPI0025493B3B|nr:uncharacterized protein N7474_006919 [Penicillium riverlandense]KAJ5815142.1 hypothetical protein N7474_006919 [Penicillium riverlandense]
MPRVRTRDGCWTCRDAGYKCDEKKPRCGRCARLGIDCQGYGIRCRWRQVQPSLSPKRKKPPSRSPSSSSVWNADFRHTTSYFSAATQENEAVRTTKQANSSLVFLGLHSDISPYHRRLLHHWSECLSGFITASARHGEVNPLQIHLGGTVFVPGALQSIVLSMSARHLALLTADSYLDLTGYRYQQNAISQLQKLIQHPVYCYSETTLATVMMMLVYSRLFAEAQGVSSANNHLLGAKAIIARGSESGSPSYSPTRRFLLSLFAYHDILSSISRRAKPFMEYAPDISTIEDAASLHRISTVLHLVARISQVHDMKVAEEIKRSRDVGPGDESDLLAAAIERGLLDLEYRIEDQSDRILHIEYTAQAYRHAALVYLYRVWHNVGAPHPTTSDHVRRCLNFLSQVPTDSPLISVHTWPLFTAGCESILPAQRQFVQSRLDDMFVVRRFPSLKNLKSDIENVWKGKMQLMKCQGWTACRGWIASRFFCTATGERPI